MNIQGRNDEYTFDPNSSSDTLRADGKFGSTYIATKVSDESKVIIKKFNSSNIVAIKRFSREAEINIEHPNLVKTIDYFNIDDDHYLIREFIPGTDLGTYSQKKKLPVEFFVQCGIQIAHALSALHEQGVIHRDVRPANIIVSEDGKQFKLIDLGLAKLATDDPNDKTPFAMIYSPPEQVMNCGEAVNETSDLYALGISLYECITGEIPFYHDHPEMMIQLMINMPLKSNKKIPKKLFEIISKASSKCKFSLPPSRIKRSEMIAMTLKGQEGRHQSAEELIMDLSKLV